MFQNARPVVPNPCLPMDLSTGGTVSCRWLNSCVAEDF